jgi:hypothetical protein
LQRHPNEFKVVTTHAELPARLQSLVAQGSLTSSVQVGPVVPLGHVQAQSCCQPKCRLGT